MAPNDGARRVLLGARSCADPDCRSSVAVAPVLQHALIRCVSSRAEPLLRVARTCSVRLNRG